MSVIPLISVVVPVYNSADLVHLPLQSLLENQDLTSTDYELICVNDGSTDNSLDVLKTYERDHENVIVISQENKGLGGARNTGLINAKGEYILFVDADDYVGDNVLKQLYYQAFLEVLDVLEFGGQGVCFNPYKVVYTKHANTNNKVLSGEEYLASVNYSNSACNKLYRREFLITNELLFTPKVYIEDIEFNSRVLFAAQRVKAVDNVYAYFVQTPGSITRTMDKEKQLKMIYDIKWVLLRINELAEKNKESIAYKKLKSKISSLVVTMMLRVAKIDMNKGLYKEITKELSEFKLYPLKIKAESFEKNLFRQVINHYPLFKVIATILGRKQ